MLEIKVVTFNELPEELKSGYWDECGYSRYILIYHNGRLIKHVSDDTDGKAYFWEDLKWVAPLLREMYELGKEDGFKDGQGNMLEAINS